MNTVTKILAPAALAFAAMGANAAEAVSTGGDWYKGNVVAQAAHSAAPAPAVTGQISTGGETYAGVANEAPTIFVAPTQRARLIDVDLERLYLG